MAEDDGRKGRESPVHNIYIFFYFDRYYKYIVFLSEGFEKYLPKCFSNETELVTNNIEQSLHKATYVQ